MKSAPDDSAPPPPESLKGRVARGGIATALGTGLRSLIDLGATLVIVRLISPEAFGWVAMVVAITGLIDMFKDMGLATVTIQSPTISDGQLSVLFWLNVGLGAALTLLTAALAPALAWIYGEPTLVDITLALSLSMLIGSVAIQPLALLRRRLQFERVVMVEFAATAVGAMSVVSGALAGLGVWALVLRQLLRPLTLAVAATLAAGRWPGLPRRAPVRELLAAGGRLTGFQVTNYIERNLDNALIGRFSGAFDLGCYTRAYDLLRLPLSQIGGPAASIALPALSRLISEGARYREAYLKILRSILLLTVPIYLFLVICADWIIPLAFGPQWDRAIPMFRWLGVALLVKPISYTTGWLFISQGRMRELLRWGLLATGIAAASFVVGLPWGAVGVAAAYSLTDVLIRAPILFYWVGRSGPVRTGDLLRAGLPIALSAALVAPSLLGLRAWLPETTPLWASCLAGAVVTLLLTVLGMSVVPGGRRTFTDAIDLFRRKRTP